MAWDLIFNKDDKPERIETKNQTELVTTPGSDSSKDPIQSRGCKTWGWESKQIGSDISKPFNNKIVQVGEDSDETVTTTSSEVSLSDPVLKPFTQNCISALFKLIFMDFSFETKFMGDKVRVCLLCGLVRLLVGTIACIAIWGFSQNTYCSYKIE